jgi:hypothetical protein
MSRHRPNFARHGLPALVILVAVLLGAMYGRPPVGKNSISDEIPPGHFLAGGERSLPILNEIAATLKRIDERLVSLEEIAIKAAEEDRKE